MYTMFIQEADIKEEDKELDTDQSRLINSLKGKGNLELDC